jgi:predicted MFS family arabinose efflux permease
MILLLFYIWRTHLADEKFLEGEIEATSIEESIFTTYRRCFAYAWQKPELRMIMLLNLLLEGMVFNIWNYLPKMVRSFVDDGGYSYGLIVAAAGCGGLIGVLVGYQISQCRPQWLTTVSCFAICLVPLAMILLGRTGSLTGIGVFYAIALAGWSIFATLNRYYCTRDAQAKFALQANNLTIFGIPPLIQMLIVLGSSVVNLTPGVVLQVCSTFVFVSIICILLSPSRRQVIRSIASSSN